MNRNTEGSPLVAANKLGNEYLGMIGLDLYGKMPKAVLAAICVSFASIIEEGQGERIVPRILEEWRALYENGIVPQKPR